MISHDHKLIFVHLRRTGGNSVEIALGGIEIFDKKGQPTTEWKNRLHRGKTKYKRSRRGHSIHNTAEEIRRRYPKEFERYFKFSIVRNPWAQMVSLHLRLHPYRNGPRRFKSWLQSFSDLEGTVPQKSLYDSSGELLVDQVIRFENLRDEFPQICERLKLKGIVLPHANASTKKNYCHYYDEGSRSLVAKMFEGDIDTYGYKFGE